MNRYLLVRVTNGNSKYVITDAKCYVLFFSLWKKKTHINQTYDKTSSGTNVHIEKIYGSVSDRNNTMQMKMRPNASFHDSYIEYPSRVYKGKPKFSFDDHVRISKYKNIFAKGYILTTIYYNYILL